MQDAELHPMHAGLVRIHRVITRGIDVARARAHTCAAGVATDVSETAGFADYLHALVSVLHAHHAGEEELAFPALRDRFPEAPWELLIDEHRAIVLVLEELDQSIPWIREDASPDLWRRTAASLDRLGALWSSHFEREEANFTPEAIDSVVPMDEQLALVAKLGAHSQQHSGPDYLVVPFLLFNLDGDERRAMAAQFPPVVTGQLVPVVWQEKWSSMKPFLFA